MSAGAQLQQYTATAAPESYYRGTEEPFWPMSCGHYLPAENGPTDTATLLTAPVWADGIQLTAFDKQGTRVTVTAANTSDVDAWVRLPLLWYKGYTARDAATHDAASAANTAGKLHSAAVRPWRMKAGRLVVKAPKLPPTAVFIR